MFRIPVPFPGCLLIGPRPRGGDWLGDEVGAWRRAGVDIVVSLLEPGEADELGLAGEAVACEAHGIRFASLPVADRGVPADPMAFAALVADVVSQLAAGRTVFAHCRQGIGRVGMVAAAVLIHSGQTTDAAVRSVSDARGRPVPETDDQRKWLAAFAAGRC
jgi:protein-tyrosine phosphatase